MDPNRPFPTAEMLLRNAISTVKYEVNRLFRLPFSEHLRSSVAKTNKTVMEIVYTHLFHSEFWKD